MKTGVFPGKFLPPHRGHITAILRAHALCDKLYVVISERTSEDGELCRQAGLPYINGVLRQRWLSQELQGLGIDVLLQNDDAAPPFPLGWAQYASQLKQTVPEPFSVIFGGEESYREGHNQFFPGIDYQVLDPQRTQWPISGTEIREHPYKHWDYIAGAARPFFARKVLITGPESCGKTTLTRKLAKVYCSSWSEELGRDYQHDVVGGNGDLFDLEDFNRIAHLQYEQDLQALRSANKVCFFDTDAVVTAFFSQVFLGEVASRVESFIDPPKYDLVIALKPTVPWVADGMRELGSPEVRALSFDKLMALYQHYGFATERFVVIAAADYYQRMEQCIASVEQLLNGAGS
ncbi:multifunctional transcriptional regulator/nicotinamide-nucleotide adenylyltransferase/ribosylnicotinamide kinase NadR [Rheinheimera nanhaiensis]|uniref:HipB family transcriptional regulator, involved in the regulation of NAD biosynthesis n=1 Tax=Rheinheimera nanhaiensis E407-8 TaxID=562729 RepID=I1E0Y5_9GAMM|nr:multifunctional transcriptional regulator/nicotinamide-nucleotide adenylyltransferase/ribosylnicotinamide kinase NadR [Rheinheimera nanhaiensis]GAB59963.1 HipB family transcriptional regulator, involved in the regulation of NAD biosynthesis [Rheinheimera nanhaiensis E407-8]